VTRRVACISAAAAAALLLETGAMAQQPISRLKGRVTTEGGEPIPNAEVRAEAFHGYAAGTFAGQRTFSTTTDAKGEWNILGVKSGIWLFEVIPPGQLPESVALPIQLLTTVSSGTSGFLLTWQLILKPIKPPDTPAWQALSGANEAVRAGRSTEAAALLRRVPEDADADYLAAAGRVSLLARDIGMARTYFVRALERDPSSYRAALGVASVLLIQRDFDTASRAFDAARSRTHDRNEQRFLSAAVGDLATIKVR
jgi:tetratricopeptide (TPR) repeat protein